MQAWEYQMRAIVALNVFVPPIRNKPLWSMSLRKGDGASMFPDVSDIKENTEN